MNLTARGDTTALQPRLKPLFHEMLDLGLIAVDRGPRRSRELLSRQPRSERARGLRLSRAAHAGRDRRRLASNAADGAASRVTCAATVELRLDDDVDAAVALAALLVSLFAIGCVSPYPTALIRTPACRACREKRADRLGASARQREVRFVAAVRVRVPLDHDLRAREHVGGLLQLLKQRALRGRDVAGRSET